MEKQRKESSEPTRQDSSDQEICENSEMYETTVNEEKQMMSQPNERRNSCVIDSQVPACSKYTTGWNFDPSFTTNNTSTLIKELKCHLCYRICKTQSGLTLHLKACTRIAENMSSYINKSQRLLTENTATLISTDVFKMKPLKCDQYLTPDKTEQTNIHQHNGQEQRFINKFHSHQTQFLSYSFLSVVHKRIKITQEPSG